SAVYSLLYNGTYMLPNTVLAVVVCAILTRPLRKFIMNEEKG
ncbi:MAG: energy-coupled thiamine transporter ThiT, partial [Oscillospiraceae bacterium]|nr:energy-coupled thiamine transporter ThiT [Oscillospiraceae bacterium]